MSLLERPRGVRFLMSDAPMYLPGDALKPASTQRSSVGGALPAYEVELIPTLGALSSPRRARQGPGPHTEAQPRGENAEAHQVAREWVRTGVCWRVVMTARYLPDIRFRGEESRFRVWGVEFRVEG